MHRVPGIVGLLAILLPGTAWTACGGVDLMAKLHTEDPAAAAAIEARAAAVPNSEGLFWRIARTGLAPSHLYGTYHASEATGLVPEAVWATLDAARIAVFEMSLAEQAAMEQRIKTDPGFVLDTSAAKFAERMSAEDLAAVRALYRARGVAVEVAERMRPWLQISLLALPPCQLLPMARGEKAMDVAMADRARARGIAEAGLETYEEALRGLTTLDPDLVLKSLIASARFADMEEDVFRTSLALYRAGRSTLIYEFSIWISERAMPGEDVRGVSDAMMVELLEHRNAAWIEKLVRHFETGNAFVAVGALHLAGETGLIELLRARGFTVTRAD